MALSIVILAAGQGKRMHSSLPKVFHRFAGIPLLQRVAKTALQLSDTPPIIIYGHGGEVVRHELAHLNVNWVQQTEQLGTGHALKQALPHLNSEDRVLVLYGDVPLIQQNTLKQFI